MKTVKQLIWNTRESGDKGGVPKFSWYLQRAIGGDVYGINSGGNGNWDNSLPIVDGNLSRFVPNMPIISIVHGTWKEFADRNGNPDFTNGEIASQHREWNRGCVVCVSVSDASARQLKKHHGKDSIVIGNCVDTDLYVPKKCNNKKPVVIYAANDSNKGCDKVSAVHNILGDRFDFQYLNARIGEEPERFASGDIYFHPSRYEGNSFACLEAMSCNLPGVYTNCGLMEDMTADTVGGIVDWTSSAEVLANEIVRVYESRDKYNPREWILKNATFDIFKDRWTKFVTPYLEAK